MNFNRNYFSRKGRSFIPKPLDPGFTIDPSKVEAYKEYCLNNGLIKFPPPIPPTVDGSMEVYDIQQSYTIPAEGKNHNLLDNIVFHYTGKSLIDFDYVLCTISDIHPLIGSNGYSTASVANIDSGYYMQYGYSGDRNLSGYLLYQSETGNTTFTIPSIGTSVSKDLAVRLEAPVESPGFEYDFRHDYSAETSISVVIETLIVGKLPENE